LVIGKNKGLIVKLHSKLIGAAAAAALMAAQAWGAAPADDKVVFPEVGSEWLQGGTFVNVDNLRQVAPGLQKDQLYDLLGRPHFKTGMFAVKEWDYLFNFRTGKGDEFVSCQYKVVFDDNYIAKSFHWKDPACAAFLAPPAPAKPVAVVAPAPVPQPAKRIALGTDGLFRFGGGALADLQPEGRRKVQALAADIQRDVKSIKSVVVTGHADRLGSPARNEALSQQRAETVGQLLAQGGIAQGAIHVVAMGQSQPLVECQGAHQSPALISCLQPNRRVEVEVIGE
jgi:outer membrane protein OmpA-like peptidoglycan-associated protein